MSELKVHMKNIVESIKYENAYSAEVKEYLDAVVPLYTNYYKTPCRNFKKLFASIVYMVRLVHHPAGNDVTITRKSARELAIIYSIIVPLICLQNIVVDDIVDRNHDKTSFETLLKCYSPNAKPTDIAPKDDKLFPHVEMCCSIRDALIKHLSNIGYDYASLEIPLKVEKNHRLIFELLEGADLTPEEVLQRSYEGMMMHIFHSLELHVLGVPNRCLEREDKKTNSLQLLGRLANDIGSMERELEEDGENSMNYAICCGSKDKAMERFEKELEENVEDEYIEKVSRMLLELYIIFETK